MAIETLGRNPTNQIESLANSLPDKAERDLIFAFLQNPIIAGKIEQTPNYVKSAKTQQERDKISGQIAGWAFEWLSFIYLLGKTKHILLSPQDIPNLYQKLYPDREFKDFFFEGKLPINTRVPDMMVVRNAGKTLQITSVIEAKAGKGNKNEIIGINNLYGNLRLVEKEGAHLLGQYMHEIKPDLEAKPVVFFPKCRFILTVPSNSNFSQPKYLLEKIPISSTTLRRLEQAITSGSI